MIQFTKFSKNSQETSSRSTAISCEQNVTSSARQLLAAHSNSTDGQVT